MLPPTHILSGWCFGNLIKLTGRERLFCMLAASLPDLDGLGIIFGQSLYLKYHHIVGHNILFGIICSAVLSYFSKSKIKSFFIYVLLFHVHLIMDYYGSGPEWGIYYLWPFSNWLLYTPHAWPFNAWQNSAVGIFLIVWMFIIMFYHKRTPLELLKPSLDRQIIELTEKFKFAK